MAINDITGDKIRSKVQSSKYADNYNRIFRKDKNDETMPSVSNSKNLQESEEMLEKKVK